MTAPADVNPLLTLHAQLLPVLVADPLHRLTLLVAVLDPFRESGDEDALYAAFESGDSLLQAAYVTRQVFPDLYGDLVSAQAGGASATALETLVLTGFAQRGLPLDMLDGLASGIPLSGGGVCLEEPTLYNDFPELIGLLTLFGVTINPEHDAIEIPSVSFAIDHTVYQTGAALAYALVTQPDPCWQDVGWWLGWAFSATGNSLLDLTHEDMGEMPPLTWTPDDVAFARVLVAEANTVMAAARRGGDWLQATPPAVKTLKHLIHQTRRGLRRHTRTQAKRPKGQKGSRYVPRLKLDGAVPPDRSQ